MKKFRLTKEAVPFFKEDLATKIGDYQFWQAYNVDEKALEEVEPVFIEYGQRTSKTCSSLVSWSADKGQELRFTLHFPSMKFFEHNEFSKGRVVRELMNRLQSEANSFMLNFMDMEE